MSLPYNNHISISRRWPAHPWLPKLSTNLELKGPIFFFLKLLQFHPPVLVVSHDQHTLPDIPKRFRSLEVEVNTLFPMFMTMMPELYQVLCLL